MILITGGTGFIGSHAALVLMQAGLDLIILDNLSNSEEWVLEKLNQISNKKSIFIKGDIRDKHLLENIFQKYSIEAVIHFAGLKSVNESVQNPLTYYDNNVQGTLNLLSVMQNSHVFQLVFSSSATVYGVPASVPIFENFPLAPVSPYGSTKFMVENILKEMAYADKRWKMICLRYFNPVGAHQSGLIGEMPKGIPNNLMPYLSQVASGVRPYLNIYGNDYETLDGTGVRDFIHVMDLAEGHLAALQYLQRQGEFLCVNLGTGRGISVLELVKTYETVIGKSIPCEIQARRPGDVGACWANVDLAKEKLHWQAKRDVKAMCEDSWRWESHLRAI